MIGRKASHVRSRCGRERKRAGERGAPSHTVADPLARDFNVTAALGSRCRCARGVPGRPLVGDDDHRAQGQAGQTQSQGQGDVHVQLLGHAGGAIEQASGNGLHLPLSQVAVGGQSSGEAHVVGMARHAPWPSTTVRGVEHDVTGVLQYALAPHTASPEHGAPPPGPPSLSAEPHAARNPATRSTETPRRRACLIRRAPGRWFGRSWSRRGDRSR
jgi:hypothetical protein